MGSVHFAPSTVTSHASALSAWKVASGSPPVFAQPRDATSVFAGLAQTKIHARYVNMAINVATAILASFAFGVSAAAAMRVLLSRAGSVTFRFATTAVEWTAMGVKRGFV